MKELIISVNKQLVEKTGESHNIINPDRLDAIQGRIANSYYPEHFAFDAAIVVQGVAHDHPFEQGNKRTGFAMMKAIILENNHVLTATEDESYQFIMDVINGMELTDIANWILMNIRHTPLI